MTAFKAFIIGFVQGLTEFFPISSSLHVKLVSNFLEIENSLTVALFCHLATSFSVLFYFRKTILDLLLNRKRDILLYLVAICPLILVYFTLGKMIKGISDAYLGPSLVITSAFLFTLKEKKASVLVTPEGKTLSFYKKSQDAFFIGFFQSLALIPGLSRSALTLKAATARGWSLKDAFCFSYLLSVPTVWGGCLLEFSHIGSVEYFPLFLAFTTAFFVGCFGLYLINLILFHKKVFLFGFYCLFLGLVLSVYRWVL